MTTPTLSQLGEMTDEELKETLAPLVGWNHFGCTGCACTPCRCNQWIHADHGPCDLPDWPNDANAVAEVRKGTLNRHQREAVVRILYWMLIPKEDQYEDHTITGPILERIANAEPREITIAIIQFLTP
jgi:hypothetical protein